MMIGIIDIIKETHPFPLSFPHCYSMLNRPLKKKVVQEIQDIDVHQILNWDLFTIKSLKSLIKKLKEHLINSTKTNVTKLFQKCP